MIVVPDEFARDTVTRAGERGQAWLDALPALFERFCHEWNVVVDGAVMRGYLSLVMPVRGATEPAVLKITWVDAYTADEICALALWDGNGAVRLLRSDPAHGAMLLERLDFRRSLDDIGIEEAVTIAGRLLRRLAIPAPDGVRTAQSMATEIALTLVERWERYGRPMPRRTLDHVRDLADQLRATTGSLLVNYDLHYANVLASAREPWLAVDPKVASGDPEFGVAQLVWRRLEDMEREGGLMRHFRLLCEAAELDPALARRWTVVRCVDYWLWGLSVGLTLDPARCERIVAALLPTT